jgi:hypothetical protein
MFKRVIDNQQEALNLKRKDMLTLVEIGADTRNDSKPRERVAILGQPPLREGKFGTQGPELIDCILIGQRIGERTTTLL